MTNNRHNGIFYGVDGWTVLLYVLIVAAGWISITSASYDDSAADLLSFSHFYMKQLMWIGMAWVTAIIVLLLDERFYHMFAYPAYLGGIALLVAALLFGREVNGAKAWFEFGSLRVQPVEFAKIATALALAGLVLLNLGGSQGASTAALILPLLAGACYGAYFVFSKPLGRVHAPEHIMLLLCAGSGILLLPVHFCTPPLWLLQPQGLGMALYLGVVTAALVEPLGAACWGIFLLHEPVGGQELAGMGLLFGGVALLALGKKTEGTEPTEEREHSRPLTGKGAPQH